MFDHLKSALPPDLEEIAPGAQLGAVLAMLDYDELSSHDLVRVLKAQQRQAAHYQAASYWTMNEIVSIYEDPDSADPRDIEHAAEGAAAEIGAALRLTRRSAEAETSLAYELNRKYPSVLNALLAGRIDLRRARVLVDATLHVHPTTAQTVVESVLPDAAQLTTGQLRHRIAKLCIDANPDDAEVRYEFSLDDRRLVLEANPSGTANLMGMDVPPHVAQAIKRRIHRMAIELRNAGDTRTMDQLRADIFLDLLRQRSGKAHHAGGGDKGGVHIEVDLPTLAGLKKNAGHLNGYGPVIDDIARQTVDQQHDSPWTWTARDPETGQPVAGGITRRRPTAGQRRKAEALHRTCVHPGCRMPAVDCDIDHRIPWAESRITCTEDLGPMCRHHHRIRHAFGWTYELADGGDFVFTTPLGHRHTTSGRPP